MAVKQSFMLMAGMVILTAAGVQAGENGKPSGTAGGKHLFILSGQSNMQFLDPNISFTPMVEEALGKANVLVVKDAQGGSGGGTRSGNPRRATSPRPRATCTTG